MGDKQAQGIDRIARQIDPLARFLRFQAERVDPSFNLVTRWRAGITGGEKEDGFMTKSRNIRESREQARSA